MHFHVSLLLPYLCGTCTIMFLYIHQLKAVTFVFFSIAAARSWLEDESTNHGILITVTTLTGEPIEDGIIRFAQRGKHHDTKQPILVMFTDDVTRKMSPKTKFEGEFSK